MIALDTNVLVYAHKEASPYHLAASQAIAQLLGSQRPCALPWPCVHEFLNVVTSRKIYTPASTLPEAFGFLDSLLGWPQIRMLAESPAHWANLRNLLIEGEGPRVPEARVAAICVQHGVTEIWSADGDFSRFPSLKSR